MSNAASSWLAEGEHGSGCHGPLGFVTVQIRCRGGFSCFKNDQQQQQQYRERERAVAAGCRAVEGACLAQAQLPPEASSSSSSSIGPVLEQQVSTWITCCWLHSRQGAYMCCTAQLQLPTDVVLQRSFILGWAQQVDLLFEDRIAAQRYGKVLHLLSSKQRQ